MSHHVHHTLSALYFMVHGGRSVEGAPRFIQGASRASRGPRASRAAHARHPARAAHLRQPQPADGRDRAHRLRHGLHAGALPPAQPRGAVDPAARSRSWSRSAATPRRSATLDYDPHLRRARPGGRSPATATSSRWTATATSGASTTAAAARHARSATQLYRAERIRLSSPRYAWIDTLFALPEAVMYAAHRSTSSRAQGRQRALRASCGRTSASASTRRTATSR